MADMDTTSARHLRWPGSAPFRRATVIAALTILGLMGLAAPAALAADDLALRGAAIAAAKCSACHAVGRTDASPHRITPPLRALAERFPVPMLVEALKTGTIAGHDEMPQFDLEADDVRALVAYIDSLTPGGPHYLKDGR